MSNKKKEKPVSMQSLLWKKEEFERVAERAKNEIDKINAVLDAGAEKLLGRLLRSIGDDAWRSYDNVEDGGRCGRHKPIPLSRIVEFPEPRRRLPEDVIEWIESNAFHRKMLYFEQTKHIKLITGDDFFFVNRMPYLPDWKTMEQLRSRIDWRFRHLPDCGSGPSQIFEWFMLKRTNTPWA